MPFPPPTSMRLSQAPKSYAAAIAGPQAAAVAVIASSKILASSGFCVGIRSRPLDSRKKSREMRVVKIDHEEILCNYKVRVVDELAPSFEALVQSTIDLANRA